MKHLIVRWKSMVLKAQHLVVTLDGLTLIGTNDECAPTGVDGEIADYRKGATGDNNNIYVMNFTAGKDIELDKAADNATYMAGTLTFAGFEFTPARHDGSDCFTPNLTDGSIFNEKAGDNTCTFEADGATICTVVADGANTVGATAPSFAWTFAEVETHSNRLEKYKLI